MTTGGRQEGGASGGKVHPGQAGEGEKRVVHLAACRARQLSCVEHGLNFGPVYHHEIVKTGGCRWACRWVLRGKDLVEVQASVCARYAGQRKTLGLGDNMEGGRAEARGERGE